jgi:HAD superfamily hydrolase (TIGR01509 family)
MAASFETILFDFGGTLYSYSSVNPPLRTVIQEAAERLGSDRPRREVGRAYGEAFRRAWNAVDGLSYYRHRDLMIEGYRFFADGLGGHASDDFLDWMYETSRIVTLESFELRDDCLTTLEGLRSLGLGLAIVSNIDDDYLFPMIERCGIGPYVDRWTSSEEAGSCKPDPGFFLHCAGLAGSSPDQVLYVGDSPFHDVKGAKGAGMTATLIVDDGMPAPGQGSDDVPHPDFTIRRLSELLEIAGS